MSAIKETIGFWLKSISNIHREGAKKDIFLFATPRGGSTWLMEIIASQSGMKYFDEPVNIRRRNVKKTAIFNNWEDIMPDKHRDKDIIKYLKDIKQNKYRFMNPPPFRKNHRFFTDRLVFKIHELEHMINYVRDECDAYILYLLRHPIPTTLSRAVFPRLEYFLKSNYYREKYLTNGQYLEINKICEKGGHFEKGVVSWCFENLAPLNTPDNKNWLFISYEELLLNSDKTCRTMAEKLQLDEPLKMIKALNKPSTNIAMSKKDTLSILQDSNEQRRKEKLVTKWKNKITENEEKAAFHILEIFGMETYKFNSYIPDKRYLHHMDTMSKIIL
jgi:hypothetical protein